MRTLHASFILALLIGTLLAAGSASAQRLFVGLEGSPTPPTRSSDLAGFPAVTWDNHFIFEVSGAAATPVGLLYLCNGAFTTQLYATTLDGEPEHLCTSAVDLSALAYGRSTLWGYSNYADPKGIYAIDPATGDATLVLDVYTGTSFRFFGLDYNPVDDLLYGYTEYGASGLYSINIDSGEMLQLAGTIPASNGQGRGLAVGNHTVYLAATRGDDDIPLFAYDLAQGPGGIWVPFTQPYPTYHSTGGAAWIPEPFSDVDQDGDDAIGYDGRPASGARDGLRLIVAGAQPLSASAGSAQLAFRLPSVARARLTIHDTNGRTVARLVEGQLPVGEHLARWDLSGHGGLAASPGVYFAALCTAEGIRTCRLVVVR